MNKLSIAQLIPAVNLDPGVREDDQTNWGHYRTGWNLFADGKSHRECANQVQLNGWWAALAAAADCETAGYLNTHGGH